MFSSKYLGFSPFTFRNPHPSPNRTSGHTRLPIIFHGYGAQRPESRDLYVRTYCKTPQKPVAWLAQDQSRHTYCSSVPLLPLYIVSYVRLYCEC